jgi:hypothetical protein
MPSENRERRITSVKIFVEEITKFRTESPAINAEQWFFRGQKNAAWEVRPNIFRGDNLASEHIVIERAQRQNPIEFRECANNFEILTKLQHYGLGTRLLDVTLNPLVALYFATEPSSEFVKNKNGQYTQQEHDGRIYYKFVTGCALQDLQIRITMAIPFVEFGKSLSLELLCNSLKEKSTISQTEYENLVNDEYSEIIRLLQSNSFIIASNSNIRLIQQRGAFLISPSINVKTSTEVKSSSLSKAKMDLSKEFDSSFIIPAGKKEEIREELDFFNVNEATLFPELEHQMRYIQNQVKSAVGTVDEYAQYVRILNVENPRKFDKTLPDVANIVRSSLPTASEEILTELTSSIIEEIQVIDWQMKESVLSHIRRSITKNLSDTYSAVDAKSKANEIINKLMG